MASKSVDVPGLGTVKLYKRKGNRNINLRVGPSGQVHVSLPTWLPYSAGINFAASKSAWIDGQKSKISTDKLANGQIIGKAHHLYFESSPETERIKTRLNNSEATVSFPSSMNLDDEAVQAASRALCRRALKKQAEKLLPLRLAELAKVGGFSYKSISFRHLSARWGSCDSQANITLSIYLMLLPWELIDYVMWHELTHTKVMRHGPDFWYELEKHIKNAKDLRRQICSHRPNL